MLANMTDVLVFVKEYTTANYYLADPIKVL